MIRIKATFDNFFKGVNFDYSNMLVWVLLLTLNTTVFVVVSLLADTQSFQFYLKALTLNIFLLGTFFLTQLLSKRFDKKSPVALLRSAFFVSVLCVLISVFVQSAILLFDKSIFRWSQLLTEVFYAINVGLFSIVVHYIFFVVRIISYKDISPFFRNLRKVFVTLLFLSLVLTFFPNEVFDLPLIVLFFLSGLSAIILSFNSRWIAYLSTKDKIESIIISIANITASLYFIYIFYFYFDKEVVSIDIGRNVYLLSLTILGLCSGVFSTLILIFNIPTSSVLSKKVSDILSIQEHSLSLQGGTEEDVYISLFKNSLKVSGAEHGWLEIFDQKGERSYYLNQDLSKTQYQNFKTLLEENPKGLTVKDLKNKKIKSVLHKKIWHRSEPIGDLVLLSDLEDKFGEDLENMIETFLRQSTISIDNHRLLNDRLASERYEREMNIAKEVQQGLLPDIHKLNLNIDMEAFSIFADQVGGDFYDIYKLDDHRYYVAIGDVSGKGISAAFNMAQVKGIFQSLIQLNPSPLEFLMQANTAINACFEKGSFITLTMILIDQEKRNFMVSRAGHCPTIFSNKYNGAQYLEHKGLGLGIAPNKVFQSLVETKVYNYTKDDLILLYTDGITEARNPEGLEYGETRLIDFVNKHHNKEVAEIKELLIQDIQDFSKDAKVHDDYTAIIVRLW